MTCQHQNLGSAYDWLKQISLVARPIEALPRRHQYGIFELVPQTSITGNTSVVSRIVGCFLRLLGGGTRQVFAFMGSMKQSVYKGRTWSKSTYSLHLIIVVDFTLLRCTPLTELKVFSRPLIIFHRVFSVLERSSDFGLFFLNSRAKERRKNTKTSLPRSLSLSCHSSCKPVFILVFGTLATSSIYNEVSKGAFLPSFPPAAKRFCVHCWGQ